MTQSLYLICLNGHKDISFGLVDEQTYSWILTGGNIPSSIQNNIMDYESIDEDEYRDDNDRALLVIPLHEFRSPLELVRFVKVNDINIVAEYRGVKY